MSDCKRAEEQSMCELEHGTVVKVVGEWSQVSADRNWGRHDRGENEALDIETKKQVWGISHSVSRRDVHLFVCGSCRQREYLRNAYH